MANLYRGYGITIPYPSQPPSPRRGHPKRGDSIHRARVWALWCRRRILPRARTMLDCYTHGPSSPTVPLPSEEGNRLGFRANTFK